MFGDISCRKTGMYRLQFNLFNYERYVVFDATARPAILTRL